MATMIGMGSNRLFRVELPEKPNFISVQKHAYKITFSNIFGNVTESILLFDSIVNDQFIINNKNIKISTIEYCGLKKMYLYNDEYYTDEEIKDLISEYEIKFTDCVAHNKLVDEQDMEIEKNKNDIFVFSQILYNDCKRQSYINVTVSDGNDTLLKEYQKNIWDSTTLEEIKKFQEISFNEIFDLFKDKNIVINKKI